MSLMHTENLEKDMVLSEDVREINGRLLLKKGQKINDIHISIMKKWGVTEVYIFDDPLTEETPQMEPENMQDQETENSVKPLFKHVDLDYPPIKELFRLRVQAKKGTSSSAEISPFKPEEPIEDKRCVVDEIQNKIKNKEIKLPEISSITFELNEILSNPLSTADNLAQVVSKSPSLTTTLLKIVNSPFLGFTSKIDTISRAVTIVGTKEINALALVICTIDVFRGLPEGIINMVSFLKHSFACGLVSRMLAANRNIAQTEQLFVAGLIHDIGRVLIYQHFPEQAKALLHHCMSSEKILHMEEADFLGCTHTDLSRYLLDAWKFPEHLQDIINHHHHPMEAKSPVQAGIVHVADIIVNSLGIGNSGEKMVPPLDMETWESLKLPSSCFENIINQANHQLAALEPLLICKNHG